MFWREGCKDSLEVVRYFFYGLFFFFRIFQQVLGIEGFRGLGLVIRLERQFGVQLVAGWFLGFSVVLSSFMFSEQRVRLQLRFCRVSFYRVLGCITGFFCLDVELQVEFWLQFCVCVGLRFFFRVVGGIKVVFVYLDGDW